MRALSPCGIRSTRRRSLPSGDGRQADTVTVTDFWAGLASVPPPPLPKLTLRTVRDAIEEELLGYTRVELELILPDDLQLEPPPSSNWRQADTKRALVGEFIDGWTLPQLMSLAKRIVNDLDRPAQRLAAMVTEYDRQTGGVTGTLKNLIFAANGPKPELVLRDAVNNDVEIVRNAEFCLVFDQPLPRDGLSFATLIAWWRQQHGLDGDDRAVGLDLHDRLRSSLDSSVEQVVFDAYQRRYRSLGFKIPALVPQVYLHYDPYTARMRGTSGGPLERQRMDFLLLYSDRRRVIIEVDGKQHYANPDGTASPTRYAAMVSEDRRLRLSGYEVFRFGGKELEGPAAADGVESFFQELHTRMS